MFYHMPLKTFSGKYLSRLHILRKGSSTIVLSVSNHLIQVTFFGHTQDRGVTACEDLRYAQLSMLANPASGQP